MGFSVGWKYFAHNDYYCPEAVAERRKLEQQKKQADAKKAKIKKEKLEKRKKELREKEEKSQTETLDEQYASAVDQYGSSYGEKSEKKASTTAPRLNRGFGFGSSASSSSKALSTHGYKPGPNPAEAKPGDSGKAAGKSSPAASYAPRLRRPF